MRKVKMSRNLTASDYKFSQYVEHEEGNYYVVMYPKKQ